MSLMKQCLQLFSPQRKRNIIFASFFKKMYIDNIIDIFK